jgi:glycerol-3-phosphate dehydrogenase
LRRRYPFLTERTVMRLVGTYGTLASNVLGDARSVRDLGRGFGADLTEREVGWLVANEWARSADDVLWRRTKLGLRVTQAETEALDRHLHLSSTPVIASEAKQSPSSCARMT